MSDETLSVGEIGGNHQTLLSMDETEIRVACKLICNGAGWNIHKMRTTRDGDYYFDVSCNGCGERQQLGNSNILTK